MLVLLQHAAYVPICNYTLQHSIIIYNSSSSQSLARYFIDQLLQSTIHLYEWLRIIIADICYTQVQALAQCPTGVVAGKVLRGESFKAQEAYGNCVAHYHLCRG